MRYRTAFPFATSVEDVAVPLPDGVRLHARVWRPRTDVPVPALLEFSPERLDDRTAARDAQRHPWYAGHGYASVRVDARGTGGSEGVYADHTAGDGAAVVGWLAGRAWCTGRVGMFGLGPGAQTALDVAALAPDPLAAVVACAPGTASVPPLPPDPAGTGDWRALWRARLDAPGPPAPADGGDVPVPVLAVAGWPDPAAGRVLDLLEASPTARAIVGPWARQYPDEAPAAAAIGFLQETLRWWEHWLRGADTGVTDDPALRAFLGAGWAAEPVWPSPDVVLREAPLREGDAAPVVVRSPPHAGVDTGRPVPRTAADLPHDQREEDARGAAFDSAPLPAELTILGRVRVRLRLAGEPGVLALRLCDVGPDGASALVARGEGEFPGAPGEWSDLTAVLRPTGHAFRPGHRVRLAVATARWPWSPDAPFTVTLDPARSVLALPVRTAEHAAPRPFDDPEHPPPLRVRLTGDRRPPLVVTRDVAAATWRADTEDGSGGHRHLPGGLTYAESDRATHLLGLDGARTHTEYAFTLTRGDVTARLTVTDGVIEAAD
ncbi:CocE/NonD family hydrolase [Actinomadura flavalba]|uniref:CocE/NonD family hydrolase n=1 Tax=Actinomadura flavalba TaxID=1120938 RepID=UPI000361D150|nr:CocE/NonD family hydrolase [Actinomadura flavalba]